jgi:hypothetical protein
MDEITPRFISRRDMLAGAAAMALAGCSSTKDEPQATYPADEPVTSEYRQDEIVHAAEDFFGKTAQGSAEVVERVFGDLGRPNAYISGEEGGGAFVGGVRYGEGWLYRRDQQPIRVYWTGPSVGFDFGANASKFFALVYDLRRVSEIFQRFPGVEGSAYLIGGIGVNYLRADGMTIAPMRSGAGIRLGASIGYLSFSEERSWVPF